VRILRMSNFLLKNLPILTLFLAHFYSIFLREKKSNFAEFNFAIGPKSAKLNSVKISSLKVFKILIT